MDLIATLIAFALQILLVVVAIALFNKLIDSVKEKSKNTLTSGNDKSNLNKTRDRNKKIGALPGNNAYCAFGVSYKEIPNSGQELPWSDLYIKLVNI